jgi:hypothetical protein
MEKRGNSSLAEESRRYAEVALETSTSVLDDVSSVSGFRGLLGSDQLESQQFGFTLQMD